MFQRRLLSKWGGGSSASGLQQFLDTTKLLRGPQINLIDVQVLFEDEVAIVELHLFQVMLFSECYDFLNGAHLLSLILDTFLGPFPILEYSIKNRWVEVCESSETVQREIAVLPEALQEVAVKDEAQVLLAVHKPIISQVGGQLLLVDSMHLKAGYFRREKVASGELSFSEVLGD